MVDHNVAIFLYRNTLALVCAVGISVSPGTMQEDRKLDIRVLDNYSVKSSEQGSINKDLWDYLRKGLNYLEASGKDLPSYFKHPGGVAYGPLALTSIAFEDVKLHCPSLAAYTFKEALASRELYEKFAFYYADLLLYHYIKADYQHMSKEEVFNILQKAWFLGPTLYKKGRSVIASRQKRAKEFVGSALPYNCG